MNNNELMHYGVLGMKWGVRKDKYRKARTIKKGTTMYRTTPNPNENLKGAKYVTYLKVDRDHYRGPSADWIRDKSGDPNAKLYENKYTLTKDIKVASREEIKNTFDKLVQKKRNEYLTGKSWIEYKIPRPILPEFYEKYEKDVEEGKLKRYSDAPDYQKFLEKSRKLVLDLYLTNSKKDDEETGLGERFAAQAWAVGKSDEFRKQVISELKKQGFDAMVDENSVGAKGGANAEGYDPLVIFDGENVLKKKKSKEISKRTQNAAIKRYSKWFRKTNRTYDEDGKRVLGKYNKGWNAWKW